jgi:YHS domain-containing protein
MPILIGWMLRGGRSGRGGGATLEATMKDPVCGMDVDPAKAAGTSEYQGKTYYFCAKSCKAKFDANPQQYVK